jgi:hypothetical protein
MIGPDAIFVLRFGFFMGALPEAGFPLRFEY